MQKKYLCYCPECAKADRHKYGETYWHMIPQLPGVYVCPIHAVPLEETPLMMKKWIVTLLVKKLFIYNKKILKNILEIKVNH